MSTFDGVVEEFPDIRIDRFGATDIPAPLAYFLSHVHTDHTRGLETYQSPSFIYCSHATKALLLRLQKRPNRVNFDQGHVESKEFHFKHLKSLLRPLPLKTPCDIELTPQKRIRVTLYDANHCPGAVMFLIEGDRKRILYTGDIRAEKWWVKALMRSPTMVPYTMGLVTLDKIYLDTTYAASDDSYRKFSSKAAGIQSLIKQIDEYDKDIIFHIKSWTLGYEEVLSAIAAAFDTKLHVDRYKMELYGALGTTAQSISDSGMACLSGFNIGASRHSPIFSLENSRFHTCEPECEELAKAKKVIRILPVVSDMVHESGATVRLVRPIGEPEDLELAPNQIVYFYARHSSYKELRSLVKALRPKDILPCVYDESMWRSDLSMESLFGDLCSGNSFAFDKRHRARHVHSLVTDSPRYDDLGIAEDGCPQSSSPMVQSPLGMNKTKTRKKNRNGKRRQSSVSGDEGDSLKRACRTIEYPSSNEETNAHENEQLAKSEPAPCQSDSQITLPESCFGSETSQLSEYRVLARQEAYRAARNDDGHEWAELSLLRPFSAIDDVEL